MRTFRKLAATVVLAGWLAPGAAAATAPVAVAPRYDAAASAELLALVNAQRSAVGAPPLASHDGLADVARTHTLWMAASHRCEHNDALFTTARGALGVGMLGENVAYTWSLARAHANLLASPQHRANIENPAFRLAGVAVVVDGEGTYWVTEVFAAPRARVATRPAAAPTSKPRTAARPSARPVVARAVAARPAARPARRPTAPATHAPRAARPARTRHVEVTEVATRPEEPLGRNDGLPWLAGVLASTVGVMTAGSWRRTTR